MAERDARYNRSRKGRARNKRVAASPRRLAYMRKWQRERRRRMKAEARKGKGRS